MEELYHAFPSQCKQGHIVKVTTGSGLEISTSITNHSQGQKICLLKYKFPIKTILRLVEMIVLYCNC